MMKHVFTVLAALGLAFLPQAAKAHRLKVFASGSADGVIEGYAYFSANSRPSGLPVECLRAEGRARTAETATGEAGAFRFEGLEPDAYVIRVTSGDGHTAEWRIDPTELGGTEPDAAREESNTVAAPEHTGDIRALAAQVAALREALDAYEARIRFRDVLGGLGWLAGLTGLGFWWSARSKRGAAS